MVKCLIQEYSYISKNNFFEFFQRAIIVVATSTGCLHCEATRQTLGPYPVKPEES